MAIPMMSSLSIEKGGLPTLESNLPQEFLQAHNPSRSELSIHPLVWNETVATYARDYANKRAKDCALQHSQGPYGENIAEGVDFSAKQAVDLWVAKLSFYNYDSNSKVGGECLHYTQVVWRNTESIGCAKAICKNGWTFATCNYYPPGNYIGDRPY